MQQTQEIYVYGAGGLGREYWGHSYENNNWSKGTGGRRIMILGYVDDNPENAEVAIGSHRFKCTTPEELARSSTAGHKPSVAIAIGDPKKIKEVAERWGDVFEFPNVLFHPIWGLNDSVKMGKGNIITPGCRLTIDVQMGDFNIVNIRSYLAHGVRVGSWNNINPDVRINGNVVVGDGSLLGAGATFRQGVRVGNNSIVGMGAVVIKDIPSDGVWVGNPAKPIQRQTSS